MSKYIINADCARRGCPKPHKRAYATRRLAKERAKKYHTPYRCVCGAWHLANKTRHLRYRKRRAAVEARKLRKV